MTDEHRAALKSIVDERPELYLDEIAEELLGRTMMLYHTSTISRTLTDRNLINYSLKYLEEKACQQDVEQRAAFRDVVRSLALTPDQFIWIDETQKSRNASRRRKGWGPRGRNNDISRCFSPNGECRYTMLAAADIDGFILDACEVVEQKRTKNDTNEYRGTIDTSRFLRSSFSLCFRSASSLLSLSSSLELLAASSAAVP